MKADLDKKKKEVDDKVNHDKTGANNKVKQEASNQLKDMTKKLPKLSGF
jgi:hypothetical protein